MKFLLPLVLVLAACSGETSAPQEPVKPEKTERPDRHWVSPHFRAECFRQGMGIMIAGQDSLDEVDMQNLQTAIDQCPKRYPDHPCLRGFTVTGVRNYKVVCGFKDEET